MLALVLCLGLWACGLNADEMKEILCYGEWVSEDNIDDTIGLGYEQTYPAIRFFIDGYCEVDLALYKDGQLTGSDTNTYTWKIEDGKVALVPVNADSDILYYEYEDGVLVGSARYRDRFTYTHVDSEHRLEDTYDTFSDARLYKEAQALLAEGNWEEAYALFAALGDYQDAEEYASGFYHRVKELHYDSYSISSISKWNYEYFVYYTYDEKGNLICEETVVPERPDAVTPHTWEYAYDENGIMTQATVTNYADSIGKQVTSSTTYEYDPNGLILSWSSVKYSNGAEIPNASDYENTFFDNGCLSYQKSTTVNENSTTIIEHANRYKGFSNQCIRLSLYLR